MSAAYRSLSRHHGDVLALALSMSTLALLALLFPFDVFRHGRAPVRPKPRTQFAFVTLSKADEARLLAAARSTWRVNAVESGRAHIDLYGENLPPPAIESVSVRPADGLSARMPTDAMVLHQDARVLLPPSRAAASPRSIGIPDEKPRPPAFPREELLRL